MKCAGHCCCGNHYFFIFANIIIFIKKVNLLLDMCDLETLRELDQIRETMAPPPSRSALINQAVKEYVDRHRKTDQGKKEPID
jgi:hypothetical protein